MKAEADSAVFVALGAGQLSASRVRTKMDAVICRAFACDSELYADSESAKMKLIRKH